MKVTKIYLKQVIKEELERYEEEQNLEEAGFLTRARQAIFGKNDQEKIDDQLKVLGKFKGLLKMGKEGTLDAQTKRNFMKQIEADKWDSWMPTLANMALSQPKFRELLRNTLKKAVEDTYDKSQETVKQKRIDWQSEYSRQQGDIEARQQDTERREKEGAEEREQSRLASLKSFFKPTELSPEQSLEFAREKAQRERDTPGTYSDTSTGHKRASRGTHEFSRK